ncbi:MAG: hypothetical protein WDA22_10855 [Bacteroidota bacterium]
MKSDRLIVFIGMILFVTALNVAMIFAQTPISIYNNFSGTVNYTVIGGSLRTSGNTVSATALRTTDTSRLVYPTNAIIVGAYLYWGGSGATPDNSVTLDGSNSFTATRTFTESNNNGGMRYWFGGFVDVTSFVQSQSNNHVYTFGNLTVDNTGIYASSQSALASWAMVIVYHLETEVKKSINIYDGFKIFKGSQITVTPNNFYVPYALVQGKMTHITYEGDKENSTSLSGYSEEVKFNGTSLTDANNPTNNQFGSLSNNFPEDSTFGLDIDTYDITSYLSPADTQATSDYSSGGDLVILNVEIISIADTANSDIRVTKTHSGGSIVAGTTFNYTISVQNYGPDTTGTITLTDSLPSGLTFVSSTFAGANGYGSWTIDSSARPKYVWTHTGAHPDSTTLPPVTVTAYITAENYPNQQNSAYASSPQFDRKPWNNTSTDVVPILTPIFLTSTKSYSDLNGGSIRPGDTLLYTISVANSGNYPAYNISVIDSMPTGMRVVPSSFSPSATYTGTSTTGEVVTFGTYAGPMNVSGSTSFQFRAVLDSTILGSSTITNVARVRSATVDQRVTSTFVPVNAPPMDIQKSRYSSGVGSGDTIRYFMVVTNTSSYATSTNTQVIDTIPEPSGTTANNPYYITSSAIPSGVLTQGPNTGDRDTILTWSIGTLAPGAVDTVEFKVRISSGLANGTTVTNKATVINTQGSRDSVDYSFVKQAPVVTIQKYQYPPGSGTGTGDTIQYYLVITNTDLYGYSTNTQVIDTIPNPVTANTTNGNRQNPYYLTSGTSPAATIASFGGGGANNLDTSLTWNLGTMTPGEIDTIKFKMRVPGFLATGTTITNKGTVTNDQGRRDSSSFDYKKAVFYSAKLTGTQYILPGDSIYYSLFEADTNKNVSLIESLTLQDTNKVTSEREGILVTETGANTGLFAGKITTVYGASAGTNNNASFNVKPGDSIRISYIDKYDSTSTNLNSVKNVWRSFVTRVLNGHAVALSGSDSILPTQTIYYTLNDSDLNRHSTLIESYSIRDSNQVTGEIENLIFTETGVNSGIFTSTVPTVFGISAGTNNDGTFTIQKGDTITLKYYDSVIVNGTNGGLKTWKTYVKGGATATLTSTSPVHPADSILITITDGDLNANSGNAETYSIKDSSITTGEVETFTVTETGINTGIFTKMLATQFGLFAGTNNNGSFNVKNGDSLRVTYYDTLLITGGPGGNIISGTLVIGGATGTISATTPHHPGDSLTVTVTDADLNRNTSVAETYTIKDSSIVTGEVESFAITETGINTGIFINKLGTQFGLSAGANNDGRFNVQAGDTLRAMYRDTMLTNGGPGSFIFGNSKILGGVNASLTATSPIYPSDSLLITIVDNDLNRDTNSVQVYSVKDSSISTGEVETFPITETGNNTGIFTKKLGTQFGLTAGTNNDGKFNVKTNDSLRVTYIDTLQLNGGSVTLSAFTKILGGVTATITSTTPVLPGDSLLITVTDADLNKNITIAETYTIKDSSIATGEVEVFAVTETGVNTGIFTKKLGTQFGLTIGTNNDGRFNVKAADTLRASYIDSLQNNGGSATLVANTGVIGGVTAVLTSNPVVIPANDSSTFTLTDNDLNKNSATVQSYTLTVQSTTGESETMIFTETGINTGVFTKTVTTIFGTTPGTNNNEIFTVQPGDTIRVSYLDSLRALGDTATVTAIFRIGTVTFTTSTKTYVDGNGGFVKPPDTLLYTVKVKNSGSVGATSISLKDTLPTDVTILTGTISGGGSAAGRVISWPLFNLSASDSATYQYQIRVDSTIVTQTPSINKATIDGNGIRYQVTASFTPVNRPLMTMSKVANRTTGKPGDTVMYTINYSNTGTANAYVVTVTDAQPDNTTYVPNSVIINSVAKSDAADADEVELTGITIQLKLGIIQPGVSGTVTLKVRIN